MRKSEGKILGILGGMGPAATQEFYKMIIMKTDAKKDQEHINSIILNHATMPDRTYMINTGRTAELLEIMTEDAVFLEKAGADFIAIPCNTSHVIVPELQKSINIPIISMIEEAAKRIYKTDKNSKVAILATDGTIKTRLYQDALAALGVESYVPDMKSQTYIMEIIYDGIKAGGEIDFEKFLEVEREIKQNGCTVALMACTELSCFKMMYELPDFYIDAMEVLADEAIIRCRD